MVMGAAAVELFTVVSFVLLNDIVFIFFFLKINQI